ncbi:sensor histidine kinase [Candidatus Poriferisodalis sp.]|uniref:sensor histidine kinase n=1 Tax=Candidatus Poriferisodalis sp. TaxID=3101277 RepID=UPI003B023429
MSLGRPRPLRRLPLRARVVGAFTLGATLAAFLLVVMTYSLSRGSMLRLRQDSSQAQFFANATQVQNSLRAESPDFAVLLESLPSLGGSRSIVRTGPDTWRSPSLVPNDLPAALIEAVERSGRAHVMRYRLDGGGQLALGLRLRPAAVSQLSETLYFEVVPLSEIEATLASLRLILGGGAALTVLIGVAVGAWAGGRLLRPLATVSDAANSIARGRFDTRVDPSDDPDLAVIVKSFNDMADAMERRIARDARFASDVSHELRSPLQTLRASIDFLNGHRDQLSAHARTALDLLAADVDRFQQLVQDLLEISRPDAENSVLERGLVNVTELVQHRVRALEPDVDLEVGAGAEDAVVIGDKRGLAQVFDNLLRNADKHGGGATRVAISRPGNSVRIAVEDNGPGVAPSERELVFERFARGAAARKRGAGTGAGLGLALVYEHTRRHGGSVHVESLPDGRRGASFVVELPIAGHGTAGHR